MVKRFLWILMVPAVALTAILLTAGGAVSQGQHVEAAGNNLSFPVIFGEGSIPLRGSPGFTSFEGDTALSDPELILCWIQKDVDNIWQADWSPWGDEAPSVSWVDWGDNLESQDWKTTSKVRVETVLFKDLATSMAGYTMYYIEGLGTSEVWGTNQETYESPQATVYSDHARLTIQKVAEVGGNPTDLYWDSNEHKWTGGAAQDPDFNGGCWENVDGPGGYSAEVNVSGKAIYGFNWDVRSISDGEDGVYRITFSLDVDKGTGTLFTNFFGAQVLPPSEGEELLASMAGGGRGGKPGGGGGGIPGGGGTAVIDPTYNLTYIDVTIKAGGGGGGRIR
jgi:hypothetical protein